MKIIISFRFFASFAPFAVIKNERLSHPQIARINTDFRMNDNLGESVQSVDNKTGGMILRMSADGKSTSIFRPWPAVVLLPALVLAALVLAALPARLPAAPPAQSAPRPAEAPATPQVPPNVLFRPVFLTPDFPFGAGTAFRLRDPRTNLHYLVTSHSLLGPAGGLDVQMKPMDITRIVMALAGVSCTDPRVVVLARSYVFLEDARVSDQRGSERDLALFALPPEPGLQPALQLDPAPPVAGDRLWVLLKYAGTQAVGMEPGRIVSATPNELRYLCENEKADLGGAAGAPLLSAQGRVLGMHLGTLKVKSGRLYGYACPAGAIQQVLDPAWTPPPAPPVFAR